MATPSLADRYIDELDAAFNSIRDKFCSEASPKILKQDIAVAHATTKTLLDPLYNHDWGAAKEDLRLKLVKIRDKNTGLQWLAAYVALCQLIEKLQPDSK